ncbi:SNF2 family N-terminal domain-containing protein [Globomyces pollinis-pini]|nr:SNF2 family N-terminal domain-containing protein [Globomyces pollinis-pini]
MIGMNETMNSEEQAKLSKLNSLIDRAGIYSQFMADKIEAIGTNFKDTGSEGQARKKVKLEQKSQRALPLALKNCDLRDYQIVGLEWLIGLFENGLNGILADEMGLGKTIQTIAFFCYLIEAGMNGPFLVVAPLSTLKNWATEFDKFAPSIDKVVYHGDIKTRASLRKRFINVKSGKIPPIIITSYEMCMNDRKHLDKLSWKYIVVDEGHRLKNLDCKLIKELKKYTSANRLLLTGTPLQNNLSELWSLLNFLMPNIFNDLSAFEEWFQFAEMLTSENNKDEVYSSMVSSLHQILKPFLLRRIKSDVMKDLPMKREYLLFAPMVEEQKDLYEAVLTKTILPVVEKYYLRSITATPTSSHTTASDLSNEAMSKTVTEVKIPPHIKKLGQQGVQNRIMQLRKVCNHPYLFGIGNDYRMVDIGSKTLPEVVAWSGKMRVLDQLLDRLLKLGHKVLIFSQMTKVLDVIGFWLEEYKKLSHCRIDGMTCLADRQAEIDRFNTEKDTMIFLLSTRAGGLGINLTAADTVIIFDSDWNPQVDLQAQDRVHRIGQTRPVIIYRLVTEQSAEQRILLCAKNKRKLEKLVIHKSRPLKFNDGRSIQGKWKLL